jgi:hypothetical protein
MKRTSPPIEMIASELGQLIGASENMLLRLVDLGGLRLASRGGSFMGFTIQSSFWVEPGEIEQIRQRLLAARQHGMIVD